MTNRKNITEMFNGLEGTEDLFKDELDDELSPESADVQPELDEEEYKKWLEEGIKSQKGYGSKEELQGTISEKEFSEYYKSTDYSYQRQSDTTAQMIQNLKEKDNQKAARDHLILSMLPMGHKAEKADYTFDKLIACVVYVLSFMVGWSLGTPLGATPAEKWFLGSITGIIGTFVKLDGVENYPFEEIKPKMLIPVWTSFYILFMWVAGLIGIDYPWIVRGIFYIVFLLFIFFHFDKEYKFEPKMARTKTVANSLIMLLIILSPIILMAVKDLLTKNASTEGLIEGVDRNNLELLFRL